MLTGRQFRNKYGSLALWVDKKADEPHTGRYLQATEDLKHFMRNHGFKPYEILIPHPGEPPPLLLLNTLLFAQ